LVAAAANAAPSSTSMVPPTMTNVDEPTESVAPAAPWATAGAWETRSESDGRSRATSRASGRLPLCGDVKLALGNDSAESSARCTERAASIMGSAEAEGVREAALGMRGRPEMT